MVFKKKKFDFFIAMEHMSSDALKSSELLNEIINNFDTKKLLEQSKKIHEIEDYVFDDFKKIMHNLYFSFISLFDGEDIVLLVNKLDNIIDGINGLTYEFHYLNVHEL